jgi:hypothetical protein
MVEEYGIFLGNLYKSSKFLAIFENIHEMMESNQISFGQFLEIYREKEESTVIVFVMTINTIENIWFIRFEEQTPSNLPYKEIVDLLIKVR